MAVSIRKLAKAEADEAFGRVDELTGQDLILAMALKLVQRHEALRTRTLVAHLKEWGKENLVRGPLAGIDLDEAVWQRALALLAIEAEMTHSDNAGKSALQRAQWTRDHLHRLLEQSAVAIEAAKQTMADRVKEAQVA